MAVAPRKWLGECSVVAALSGVLSVALSVALTAPAWGAEVRRLRAEPEQPGVGQPFALKLELKTKWHEADACDLVLVVDGQEAERDEFRPTVEVRADHVVLRRAQAHGLADWRWPRNGDEIRFDWVFDTPGPHRLNFDPKRSDCSLKQAAELTVNVQPDYRALSFEIVGVPEVAVSRKLDNTVAYLSRGGDTEVVVPRQFIDRWRRAFEGYQPGSWEQVQWPSTVDFLKKTGVQRARLTVVDDWADTAERWSRNSPDRLLLVPGTEFGRLAAWKTSGQFVALLTMDSNVLAKYYREREVAQAEQARRAEAERQERTARVWAALPASTGQVTALRRVPAPAGKATVCARRMDAPVGGDLMAYRKTEAVAQWLARKAADGFDDVFNDLDAMYLALKQSRCGTLVLTDAEARTVGNALQRDQIGFELFELRDAEALLPAYAAHYGYASVDDARLARRFSPMPDGKQAAALRAADVGTPEALGAVWQRQQKAAYPGERNIATAVAFLADEAQGRRSGQSAAEVRRKREATERAAAAAERERLVKAYPYTLQLTCRNGSAGTLPVAVCFSESNRTTLAELLNCVTLRSLGYPDLARDPVEISLCPKFVFKAQSQSEFLLVATLRDERTGQVIERQTAQRYGRIVMAR
ncbi:hypothetical protein [Roseateles sp. BYS87W]|uniref:Uncharacterized protein n=1 Tax=Pelomonas baiyunensis TaxID=3299026 RepID=A0ABW7H0V5_9BURK